MTSKNSLSETNFYFLGQKLSQNVCEIAISHKHFCVCYFLDKFKKIYFLEDYVNCVSEMCLYKNSFYSSTLFNH